MIVKLRDVNGSDSDLIYVKSDPNPTRLIRERLTTSGSESVPNLRKIRYRFFSRPILILFEFYLFSFSHERRMGTILAFHGEIDKETSFFFFLSFCVCVLFVVVLFFPFFCI